MAIIINKLTITFRWLQNFRSVLDDMLFSHNNCGITSVVSFRNQRWQLDFVKDFVNKSL